MESIQLYAKQKEKLLESSVRRMRNDLVIPDE